MTIYTIGHSNRTLDALLRMLDEQRLGCLVDVRSRPGSTRFPWFDQSSLERALGRVGIHYFWEGESLGGRRPAAPGETRHIALEGGFRAFASHMETPAFRAGIERLLERASTFRTAVLCAEKDPRQCHRWLIADELWVRGHEVRHLIAPGEALGHRLHPAARREGGGLIYDRGPVMPDVFSSQDPA